MREYEVLYDTIEDGWIMATVPDLRGAVIQGETLEEARSNILEVMGNPKAVIQLSHPELVK